MMFIRKLRILHIKSYRKNTQGTSQFRIPHKKTAKDISAFRGFFVKELFLCAVELNELFEVSAASLCGLGGLVEELFGAVGEGACE